MRSWYVRRTLHSPCPGPSDSICDMFVHHPTERTGPAHLQLHGTPGHLEESEAGDHRVQLWQDGVYLDSPHLQSVAVPRTLLYLPTSLYYCGTAERDSRTLKSHESTDPFPRVESGRSNGRRPHGLQPAGNAGTLKGHEGSIFPSLEIDMSKSGLVILNLFHFQVEKKIHFKDGNLH